MQCESHRNKISYLTKRNAYVSGTRKRLVNLTQIYMQIYTLNSLKNREAWGKKFRISIMYVLSPHDFHCTIKSMNCDVDDLCKHAIFINAWNSQNTCYYTKLLVCFLSVTKGFEIDTKFTRFVLHVQMIQAFTSKNIYLLVYFFRKNSFVSYRQ